MNSKLELFAIALASVIAITVLGIYFSGQRKFDESAFGINTISYTALNDKGKSIHTIRQNQEEINQIMSSIGSNNSVILFLGNSQTHGINRMRVGDVNYPQLIAQKHSDLRVIVNSLPNASIQEFLLIGSWWMTKTKIHQIFIPVFMDDLREDGVRSDFLNAVLAENYSINCDRPVCKKINQELVEIKVNQSKADTTDKWSENATWQDISEKNINVFLDENLQFWKNRSNARGDFFSFLYFFRNFVFGINANSKRKIIPSNYQANMAALLELVNLCKQKDIEVVLYIPPIRNDVAIPYDLVEYEAFKKQVKDLAKENNATYANLEGIVPGSLWGMKAGTNILDKPELDFMHFQFEGHRILAKALDSLIKN